MFLGFRITFNNFNGFCGFSLRSGELRDRISSACLYHLLTVFQELFDAAKQYQPQLHRGTYYSLPEWFNPAYAPYGFGMWPGGNFLIP